MTEDQAKQWTKDKTNQRAVVSAFFKQNKPSKAKIAFFMAGIPGAGKTEFTEHTIKEASPELISIEHDQLVEYIDDYNPAAYYNYRKAGSILVSAIFDECLKQGYAFVFDGTLSHENGIRNINKCLKSGYKVIVVYIIQDTQKAWELTQARELVKKRAIEESGFIDTCNKINNNLLTIFTAHKVDSNFSFWVIDKQGQADMKNATAIIHGNAIDASETIEKILQKPYNSDIRKY